MRRQRRAVRMLSQPLVRTGHLAAGIVGVALYLVVCLWVLHASIQDAPSHAPGSRNAAWASVVSGNSGELSQATQTDDRPLTEDARWWMYGLVTVTIMLLGWLLYGMNSSHHHGMIARQPVDLRKTLYIAGEQTDQDWAHASTAVQAKLVRTTHGGVAPSMPAAADDIPEMPAQETEQMRSSRGFECIRFTDPRQLAAAMVRERSQTIALILTQLEPEHAAQVLAQLSPERQTDVTRRVIAMDTVSPELLEAVAEELAGRLGEHRPWRLTEREGMSRMAAIIRALDREAERNIMQRLEVSDGPAAAQLKQCLFSFADVARLDDTALRRLLMEVSTQDVATAMADASDELKSRILSQVSPRVADIIREEMSYVGPLQALESRAAQRQIVDAVLRLEAEEQLERPARNRAARASNSRGGIGKTGSHTGYRVKERAEKP